ncbi:MAG: hypothetical protein ACK526_03155, partial [Planctomyces sp.]
LSLSLRILIKKGRRTRSSRSSEAYTEATSLFGVIQETPKHHRRLRSLPFIPYRKQDLQSYREILNGSF